MFLIYERHPQCFEHCHVVAFILSSSDGMCIEVKIYMWRIFLNFSWYSEKIITSTYFKLYAQSKFELRLSPRHRYFQRNCRLRLIPEVSLLWAWNPFFLTYSKAIILCDFLNSLIHFCWRVWRWFFRMKIGFQFSDIKSTYTLTTDW